MLNPSELWLWHTQSPSGERLPVFRAATRDDAVEYCERVGWTELRHLQGFCPRVYEVDRATGDVVRRASGAWEKDLARMTEVTDA